MLQGNELMLRARAVTLTNYDEVARFVGLDPLEMLTRVELSPSDLRDPENWLPADKVLTLIDESAERSGRDDFGLLLGKCRSFTSLGPVALLLKHEATLYDIIAAGVEYGHLLNDLLVITVKDDGENATIEWNLVPGVHSRHGANLVAAIAYRGISEALECVWEPDCVHFRHSTPDNASTFRRFFRCPLEFDSHFDGMSCTSAALHTRNSFADAHLTAYARRLLNLLPGGGGLSATAKARSVILLMLEDGQVSLQRVAECLGVTARTLQRRLGEEGTSFSQLLNETRKDLVMRYVGNSSISLATIAQLAGFSSQGNFARWFAPEFGMTAAKYRKRARDEPGGGAT